MKLKRWGLIVPFLAPVAALAGPTGLIVIPIADIIGANQVLYTFGANGYERNVDKGHVYSHGVCIGIGDQLEVGFDNNLLGSNVVSAKFLLYETPKTAKVAVSAGVYNFDLNGGGGAKYVVGRCDVTSNCRFHCGYQFDDRARLITGMDYDLGKGWSAMADYVSGPGSTTWLAINVPTPWPSLVVTLGAGIPTDHADGLQHTIVAAYGFKL